MNSKRKQLSAVSDKHKRITSGLVAAVQHQQLYQLLVYEPGDKAGLLLFVVPVD